MTKSLYLCHTTTLRPPDSSSAPLVEAVTVTAFVADGGNPKVRNLLPGGSSGTNTPPLRLARSAGGIVVSLRTRTGSCNATYISPTLFDGQRMSTRLSEADSGRERVGVVPPRTSTPQSGTSGKRRQSRAPGPPSCKEQRYLYESQPRPQKTLRIGYSRYPTGPEKHSRRHVAPPPGQGTAWIRSCPRDALRTHRPNARSAHV